MSFLGHSPQFLTHLCQQLQMVNCRSSPPNPLLSFARRHYYSYCANGSQICNTCAFFWCSFSLHKESLENTGLSLKDISGISCSLPYFGRHFSEERSSEAQGGSVQWSRAVTSKCWCPYYQFKEMHSATYLAAVKGPGLVLWKSMLEPEWFSPWKAALTIWFRQFWCMSSIIRSASSTIWVHKDENHHLLNTGSFYFLCICNQWARR